VGSGLGSGGTGGEFRVWATDSIGGGGKDVTGAPEDGSAADTARPAKPPPDRTPVSNRELIRVTFFLITTAIATTGNNVKRPGRSNS